MSNLGYINAYNNDIQGDWKNGKNIRYKDYPKVFSISHTWKANVSDTGTISFRLLPPIWRRWWAYTCYGSFILFLLLLYRRFLINRAKLRTALEIERIEKQKIQEIEQMKSRFFANISHEFRTPLTLLLGPLNDLVKNGPEFAQANRTLFSMMKRNAERLQRLINQLLDLSKLETGSVKLQVSEGSLTDFVKRILFSFLSLAETKKIKYSYDLPDITTLVYYDAEKLEKILNNLISNAFKFTQDGGRVKVVLKYLDPNVNGTPERIELLISDSGKGISKEHIERIFDRFYQVSKSDTREEEGSGIGLSLTKELVSLYNGEINVESVPGKGSVFTVSLPAAREQFSEDEITDKLEKEIVEPETDDQGIIMNGPEISETGRELKEPDGTLILIVEDNLDLRKYISQILYSSHKLVEADNGKSGMEKAIEHIPELVISDLMMPEMDGITMCSKLKSDERTSHIPVIMLTAKADKTSKLEGLGTGADDYIIKPFDAEELRVRVENLITQRRKLREKYRKEFISGLKNRKFAPPDEQFLNRVSETINHHLSESEFNIERLSEGIGMSRSQLYRKTLAVTGYTPVEFLRNIRLKHAAHMFKEKHHNIAQVAYHVGFSNPAYFSVCFKELFGMAPSEYIKGI
jgi:signal transduction histidine kinase/DNA-binding response OmpR family regulator